MKNISVAIDGPAGAGKSSIAKEAAKILGLVYIDTGAMYRTVALAAVKRGISLDDGVALGSMVESMDMEIKYVDSVQRMFLDGEDVSEEIRTPEISAAASRVSANIEVRRALVALQQAMAKKESVIMDGRDICSCVLPDADVKIYLTASVEARAARRVAQLEEKGIIRNIDEIKAEIEKRDFADMNRENSPLKKTADAQLIDTSSIDLEQSIDAVVSYIKEKTGDVL